MELTGSLQGSSSTQASYLQQYSTELHSTGRGVKKLIRYLNYLNDNNWIKNRVVQYGGSIKYAYYTYLIAKMGKIKYVRNTALNTLILRTH